MNLSHFGQFWPILGVNDVINCPKIKICGKLTVPSYFPPQKSYPYQISGENKLLITSYNKFSVFWVTLGHFRAILGVNDAINGPKIKNFRKLTPPSYLPPKKSYPYQISGENKPLIMSYNQFTLKTLKKTCIFGKIPPFWILPW